MSNRDYQGRGVLSPQVRDIRVRGSFVPLTGAGTVVASTVKGEGFGYAPVNGAMALKTAPGNNPTPLTTPGITRVSAGLYKVVLEDPYQDIEHITCDLAGPATGSALWAQPVDPVTNTATANSGATFQLVIVNSSGTPTEANASMRLHFVVSLRDSTAHYQKP